MKAIELRNKYLNFFKEKGHKIITGAPIVPENDPTVLFTTAGMQPLVPYLKGEKHPNGTRLTNYQKCLRTNDIDEVGDNRHLTFFEMLGNWSLGDYFKQDSIKYSYELLTRVLEIPSKRLSVTCFAGDENIPRDDEAAKVWEECGISKDRIYFFGKENNWWGQEFGPCGPDTEIFYDTGKEPCSKNCDPSCECGKYIEIWNNVFLQYNRKEDTTLEPLTKKSVDTGMGLERMICILQKKDNVFETELFVPIIELIKEKSTTPNIESLRIIADHIRASAFLICDGITPSNIGQGYILRRLVRRAIRHMRKIGYDVDKVELVCDSVVNTLKDMYQELDENKDIIKLQIVKEKNRFMNTLVKGEKEFYKILNHLKELNSNVFDGKYIFKLYDTYGFPPEVTVELVNENNLKSDMSEFKKLFEEHQRNSHQNAAGTFKGGLSDHSETTTAYHTATHLTLEAMQRILGSHVMQKGSNITAERMRFDFSNPVKVTRDKLDEIENLVNEQIDKGLPVICEEMSLEDARKSGAKGVFDSKYGEKVKVYTIGDFSKEICGGPHVENTNKLKHIKIKKEEAVSSGVRRIKAVFVEN